MIAGPSRLPDRRRRGFGLVEMTATAVMLVAAMTITVQLVGWVAAERRSVARRERALLEAANLLERLAARPWDDLTPDAAKALTLSDATRAALPGAALSIEVAPAGAPEAKRITVAITWRDRSGSAEAPARLVGWAHRRGGAK
ncbi:type IV pilus modification PilV family protein [Tundrisphaera sp. TA3]|uniref:type IV pilus modification PilV family protein n=1 Tax=Tundrisphaera sp. TA3 TaxID=3435775 RepID=UPI003EBD4932